MKIYIIIGITFFFTEEDYPRTLLSKKKNGPVVSDEMVESRDFCSCYDGYIWRWTVLLDIIFKDDQQ